jgi:hypothetical protein
VAVAPDPIRIKRQRAISGLHAAFRRRNADAPFHPEEHPDSGDYNVQHSEIEADPADEWEFTQRGLAISRGELDDQLDEILASL